MLYCREESSTPEIQPRTSQKRKNTPRRNGYGLNSTNLCAMGAGAARPRMARVIKTWPHVAGRTIAREGSASCVSTSPARWAQTPEKTPAERRPRLTLKPTFSWLNRQLAAEEASRKTSRLRKAKRLQVNSVRTIERFVPKCSTRTPCLRRA